MAVSYSPPFSDTSLPGAPRDGAPSPGHFAADIPCRASLFLAMFLILAGPPPLDASEPAPARTRQYSVAILEFHNLTKDAKFQGLETALRDWLTTDLSSIKEMQIVERARLKDLIKEMQLVKDGVVDVGTAAKAGKMLGAQAVLAGSFGVQDGRLRIDARVVHVETGKVILAEEITGKTEEFLELEKRLAKKVVETFGVKLSRFESAELDRSYTRNISAAANYGRAIGLEAKGELEAARRAAGAALEADPEFEQARQLRSQIDSLLNRQKEKAYLRQLELILEAEERVMNWPTRCPVQSRLGPFDPAAFESAWKKGDSRGALGYWASRLTGQSANLGLVGDYRLLKLPLRADDFRDGGYLEAYRNLGGGAPLVFWCDVFGASAQFKLEEPIPARWLSFHPDDPPPTIYRAAFLHRYQSVLALQAETEAWTLGDFNKAAGTLERALEMFRGQPIEEAYLRQLREIRETIESPEKWSKARQTGRSRQQLWQMAERSLLEAVQQRQSAQFKVAPKTATIVKEGRISEEERKELVAGYAGALNRMLPEVRLEGGSEKVADHLSETYAKAAGDSNFVGWARAPRSVTRGMNYPGVPGLHVAGCPWARDVVITYAASSGTKAKVFPHLPDLEPVAEPGRGIEKGFAPCPHCQPGRWISDKEMNSLLKARFEVHCRQLAKDWQAVHSSELDGLLGEFMRRPSDDLRPQIHELLKQAHLHAPGDRRVIRRALQAIAAVGTTEDIPLMARILDESPYWDIRMYAAAALGCVQSDASLTALEEAASKEPYYFTHRWIDAARQRLISGGVSRRESPR